MHHQSSSFPVGSSGRIARVGSCRVAMSLYFAVKIITRDYATDSRPTYCIQATFLKKNRDTRLEKKGDESPFLISSISMMLSI
jgi:hypothetical protein